MNEENEIIDEQRATNILGEYIQKDNKALFKSSSPGIHWPSHRDYMVLHGEFPADLLEALAWWINNKRSN